MLKHLHTNAIQSAVETFSSADPSREWTVQGIAEWVGIGGFGPLLVGGPQTVADELQAWVEETDVDGFNLAYAVTHETFTDVVELLVPSCKNAERTSATTRRALCEKNCSIRGRAWRSRTRRWATAGRPARPWPMH